MLVTSLSLSSLCHVDRYCCPDFLSKFHAVWTHWMRCRERCEGMNRGSCFEECARPQTQVKWASYDACWLFEGPLLTLRAEVGGVLLCSIFRDLRWWTKQQAQPKMRRTDQAEAVGGQIAGPSWALAMIHEHTLP